MNLKKHKLFFIAVYTLCAVIMSVACSTKQGISTQAPSAVATAQPQERTAAPIPADAILGTDKFPSNYKQRFSNFEENYEFFTVNMIMILVDSSSVAIDYPISFLLPKGWYCLNSPDDIPIYLGGDELFDTRTYIYNSFGDCVGAIGLRHSSFYNKESFKSIDDINNFYMDINSDEDYYFTTREYYFPVSYSTLQFTDKYSAAALTQVFYSEDYLAQHGIQSDVPLMNPAIVYRYGTSITYLCFEFDCDVVNFNELSDIARSLSWNNI